jgi:hypothetical protein
MGANMVPTSNRADTSKSAKEDSEVGAESRGAGMEQASLADAYHAEKNQVMVDADARAEFADTRAQSPPPPQIAVDFMTPPKKLLLKAQDGENHDAVNALESPSPKTSPRRPTLTIVTSTDTTIVAENTYDSPSFMSFENESPENVLSPSAVKHSELSLSQVEKRAALFCERSPDQTSQEVLPQDSCNITE